MPEPTALKALDSDQVVIRLSGSELQYLSKAQWSDRLPRMVQAKLVQAFENTGKVAGVGKPGEGLAIDYQVISEIRSFEISTEGADTAVVEIFAKIVNDRNGTVRAQKAFRATAGRQGHRQPGLRQGPRSGVRDGRIRDRRLDARFYLSQSYLPSAASMRLTTSATPFVSLAASSARADSAFVATCPGKHDRISLADNRDVGCIEPGRHRARPCATRRSSSAG